VPGVEAKLAQSLAGDLAGVADRINRRGTLNEKDRAALLDCVTGVVTPSGATASAKGVKDGTTRQT
jgi:hypothetical protein